MNRHATPGMGKMRHHETRRLLTISLLLAAQVACGGSGGDTSSDDDGGTPSIPGPATAALFCDELYTAFAQRYADCHKAPLAWATQFMVKAKLCAPLEYAVDSGSATYVSSVSGGCLDFVETASCAELRGLREETLDVPACRAAVVGTLAVPTAIPFTPCATDYECASGRCSAGEGACSDGICFPGEGQGFACGSDHDCQPGLYCYWGSLWASGSCQPQSNRPGEGQPCSRSTFCKPGLYCQGGGVVADSGTCAPQLTSGTCTTQLGETAPGYGCFAGTVAPALGTGETCNNTTDRCGPGLYCNSVGWVCAVEPLVGASCDPSASPSCIGGYCGPSTYVCVSDFDATCQNDLDCESRGYCDHGCQAYCIVP